MPRKKPLRIGFDLDGVLLYNPARIIRRPVTTFKHYIFPTIEKKFFIPSSQISTLIYEFVHISSFKKNYGFKELELFLQNPNIESRIFTSRFGFPLLIHNTQWWYKILNQKKIFLSLTQNTNNIQPHLYKEQLIKQYGIDVYVEDNLDIVRHLSKTTNAKILWIYNIFDRMVDYPYKYSSLKETIPVLYKMYESK